MVKNLRNVAQQAPALGSASPNTSTETHAPGKVEPRTDLSTFTSHTTPRAPQLHRGCDDANSDTSRLEAMHSGAGEARGEEKWYRDR